MIYKVLYCLYENELYCLYVIKLYSPYTGNMSIKKVKKLGNSQYYLTSSSKISISIPCNNFYSMFPTIK